MKFVCLRYPRLQMTYKTQVIREVNGVILKEPTQLIQFVDGTYETEDAGQIAFIKRHSDFGVNIFASEEEKIQYTEPTPEQEKIIAKHRGRPKKVE